MLFRGPSLRANWQTWPPDSRTPLRMLCGLYVSHVEHGRMLLPADKDSDQIFRDREQCTKLDGPKAATNDPSSATRHARRVGCNHGAKPGSLERLVELNPVRG